MGRERLTRSAAGNYSPTTAMPRIVLFTGHRIDAPGRPQPRFPAAGEAEARRMIERAVRAEVGAAGEAPNGIAGGASGGDILFHEVCAELGIPTSMYLALPRDEYVRASVEDAGADWVERFDRLYGGLDPVFLADATGLPGWLAEDGGYDVWQRSNLWMLHEALEQSGGDLTLIALWNGETGDGPGGTDDMVKRAKGRGARFVHLDARQLVG